MNYEVTQQIQITGGLLSINVFQQKLMRNFYIINSKLKRLDDLTDLSTKLKSLQKQHKFISSKIQVLQEKITQNHTTPDYQKIIKQQFIQLLNNKDDKIGNTKYFQEINKQILQIKQEITKNRQQNNMQNTNNNLLTTKQNNHPIFTQTNPQNPKKNKNIHTINNILNTNQINLIQQTIKTQQSNQPTILQQINQKFQQLQRKIEQIKLSKILNQNGQKQIQKFDKYQHYQLKSSNTYRKNKQKPIRLDGIKKQNIKGQILKNDLYSDFQKAQLLRNDKIEKQKSFKPVQTYTSNFNNNDIKISQYKTNQDIQKDKEKDKNQRLKPSKSIKKLQKLQKNQKNIKIENFKQLNTILKDIEIKIQNKISHQLFIGFVQDIQQKIQILKITKDPSNQLSEFRKMIFSIQSRLQSIITFLQNSVSQDDALLVKKQWTCISCDKGVDKFSGKTGQHLNWDNLQSRKISPTKAGAFGQTGQMASKLRSLMQNQKNQE